MMTEPLENDKLTRLAVVASSVLPDITPMNDHLRHKKSTACVIDSLRRIDRAVSAASPSNSTPRYDLPSTKVRMGTNSPHEPSSRGRKRSEIDKSLNSEEQRAARTKSGIALQSHPQHSYNQQCEKPSGDSPEETVRFREFQTEIWSDRFEELCAFRRFHGHCHVPHHYSESTALAEWVKRQRYQFKLKLEGKRNTLTEERICVLHEIDFVWSSHDAVWEERFQNLLVYKHVNGHCLVPSSFRHPQLAVWTKRQRREYKKYQSGVSNSMTPDRIKKLENIGFVWDCRGMNKTEDDDMENSCDDSGIRAAANTRLTNSIGDNIQSTMVRIDSNTNFSPLVRGDGQMPTHNNMNNLSSSALQPNRICGNNDQSLVDHCNQKVAAYLSNSIRNDRSRNFYGDSSSKANMISIDSDHGRYHRLGHVNPVTSHASNEIVNNKSREFVKGTGATLINRNFDETILSARNDRKPPRIPRGDFFSYCHNYFS